MKKLVEMLRQENRDESNSPDSRYLAYVLLHKLLVGIAGRKLGVSWWRVLKHDLSKFSRAEWKPYVDSFYRNPPPRREDGGYNPLAVSREFTRAWNHHQKHNSHHWQYWLTPQDDGGTLVLPMPDEDFVEMIADFYGAGMAIKGHGLDRAYEETQKWYEANRANMILHPKTRTQLNLYLGVTTYPNSPPDQLPEGYTAA